jgi:AcrR family transcriptional regulator
MHVFCVSMSEAIDFETAAAPAPEPLPRGRHKLSVETVRASQRERLLRAMLESVADSGYEATTVPQVVAMARVSRNAFYELFDDKLGCFLALCEELSEQLLEETFRPTVATDWTVALREGTGRYLRWWQARPRFARAWLVALPTAGTRALEQRDRAYARFAERFAALGAWARSQEPGLAPLHATAPRFIVSAITDLVADQIVAGRVATLISLEDEIVWLVTRLIAEPLDARSVAA